jgi:hypothetical protein
MIKLLLKLLGNKIYQPEPVDEKKLRDWLYKSYADDGFKNYYTMRKKYIVNLLLLDIPTKERLKAIGKLEELRMLSVNVNSEWKARKDRAKKSSS